MPGRLLSTYLNDHLAGSTGALELVRRSVGANRGNAYGETLAQLAEEIEEDRATLRALMRELGVGVDRAKVALAWSAEKAGRAKLNGRLFAYSPLSRVVELEVLSLGVEGKLLLWRSLSQLQTGEGPLARFDFQILIKRAGSQRRRLERLRRRAAAEALEPDV
jgi:hypothetical protein